LIVKDLTNRSRGTERVTVHHLRQQISVLNDLEKRLESERQQLAVGARAVNTKSLDLQSVQDEIEQAQTAASKMGLEIQALEVELQAPGRITKIESAEIPRTRDDKKRYMMIGLAILGAFLGPLFGIALWEFHHQTVNSAGEVAAGLGIKLIGTLPVVPDRPGRASLERDRDREVLWQKLMCESIDMTRTMLLSVVRAQSGRVVIVTSAISGEGKTSLACHLATSLARGGRSTLLIDSDLRKPSIHRLFDQPLTPGISEVLRGETALEDAVVATSIPQLELITAGECDSGTLRALSLGGIEPLF
jgi:hypothetical protein